MSGAIYTAVTLTHACPPSTIRLVAGVGLTYIYHHDT